MPGDNQANTLVPALKAPMRSYARRGVQSAARLFGGAGWRISGTRPRPLAALISSRDCAIFHSLEVRI